MDWRGDASSLSEIVDRLYSLPGKLLYTDVKFVLTDGSQVEAHKLVLALASPVFEMEFYGGQWVEQTSDTVSIKDDMGVFRQLIEFVYKQTVDFSSLEDYQLWDLLYLANKYLITKLQKVVEERLTNVLKDCQNKSDLLKHWHRAKENILGDQFLLPIKEEIELFAEKVLSSKAYLEMNKEDVKEMLKYPNLRVTEGQIFKYAAVWCSENNDSEDEAEREFQNEFQNIIEYGSLTSEDFIQNVLPNSQIMEREVLKKITKKSFEAKTSGMSTRYAMKPVKSVVMVISKDDLNGNEVIFKKLSFQNFDVDIQTRFDNIENMVESEVKFQDSPVHDYNQYASIGIKVHCASLEGYRCMVKTRHPYDKTVIISRPLFGIESDLSIELVIDARQLVPIKVIRQDLMHLDFESTLCTNSFLTLEVNPNMNISEVTEVIKERLNVTHLRLWTVDVHGSIQYIRNEHQKIGYLLMNYTIEQDGCYFFLELPGEPVKSIIPYTHFLWIIYLKEEKSDSLKFIKNMAIERLEDEDECNEENFIRSLKYAAGVTNEEDYGIKWSDLDDIPDQKIWRKMVKGFQRKTSFYWEHAIVIVYPKRKK